MPAFTTLISPEFAATDSGVPAIVTLPDGILQGDRLPSGQIVLQFFTGNGFHHYVALLDFEEWDTERCPRYAVYEQTPTTPDWHLCQDVDERLTWPLQPKEN